MKALLSLTLFTGILISGCGSSSGSSEQNVVPYSPEPVPTPINITTNFSGDVLTSELLLIEFDQELDTSLLTYNTDSTTCIGDIQLSHDNFQTCMSLQYFSSGSQKIELMVNDFQAEKEYQLKVGISFHSRSGNVLAQEYLSEFIAVSAAGLRITEVGTTYYTASMNWLEIQNTTNYPINLSEYKIIAPAIIGTCNQFTCDPSIEDVYGFDLPNQDIQPGQFIVVRSQGWEQEYENSGQIIYLGNLTTHLYWENKGYLELYRKEGQTEDFIVFGDWSDELSSPSPETKGQWDGNAAIDLPYSSESAYSYSLARNAYSSDSNKSHDWVLKAFITPGAPNDVTCNIDLDEDGLPDCLEQEGETYAGIDIYSLGARAGRQDIFIEIDYMRSEDEGVKPRKEALDKIVSVFSNQNIAIHFDAGDLFDQQPNSINPTEYDLGGGGEVAFSSLVDFDPDPTSDIDNFYDIKRQNFDVSRLAIFHYLLMGNEHPGGASGIAEMEGNDLIVTLGGAGLNSSDDGNKNILINFQASTIMHELGHNLGLGHGGNEDKNYKPNYLSVMNYLYSFMGLPDIGNNEGDRFYNEYCGDTYLVNSPIEHYKNYKLDYSYGGASTISEGAISEGFGLGYVDSEPVDFNCNGWVDNLSYRLDINNDVYVNTHRDHDDWSNLKLKFQRSYWSHASLNESKIFNEFPVVGMTVGDDRAVVVTEVNSIKNIKKFVKSHKFRY